jgi:hypothetical protein
MLAAAAFALYVPLQAAWLRSGGSQAYAALLEHFIRPLSILHFDGLVLLAASCAVVAFNLPWRTRVQRLMWMAGCLVAVQVAATLLQNQINRARDAWATRHVLLVPTGEIVAALWAKHFLFELGYQVAPFVIVGLWMTWNAACRARDQRIGTPDALRFHAHPREEQTSSDNSRPDESIPCP